MSEIQTEDQVVERPADVVTRIIAKIWVPLLIVLVAAAIALIVTLVVNGRRHSLIESSTVLIDEEIIPTLELLSARHSNRYAGRRALQLLSVRHVERAEWQEAADNYIRLSELSEGYLAAVALSNAAAAVEELGDYPRAITLYRDVALLYPEGMAGPRALFSIGRLQEKQGEALAAGDTYAEIESLYASSHWSLLARNRLIFLRASGALEDR